MLRCNIYYTYLKKIYTYVLVYDEVLAVKWEQTDAAPHLSAALLPSLSGNRNRHSRWTTWHMLTVKFSYNKNCTNILNDNIET